VPSAHTGQQHKHKHNKITMGKLPTKKVNKEENGLKSWHRFKSEWQHLVPMSKTELKQKEVVLPM